MEDSDVKVSRRSFLKRSTLVAGGFVTATTLQTLAAHTAYAKECKPDARGRSKGPTGKGYGALKPVTDQNGDLILALPDGFHYTTFSKTGDAMSDGFATPAIHDGMSAFKGPDGTIRLIRNHEIRNAAGNFAFGVVGSAATRYDALASGGCTTIDYDPKHKRIVRDFISINGTLVNCSGGRAYNDVGWITSEETTSGPNNGYSKKHGYNFLVRADINAPEPAVALTAMGRFEHEAAVADLESGIVYQTEDSGGKSGFYRFLPNDPGNLVAGGVLQMARIRGLNGYDTRTNQTVGTELRVEWVTIDNPDPDPITSSTSCFAQGLDKGGARWNRLEGISRGEDGTMYFVSTSGGNAARGQLWQFIPSITGGGTLVLVFESPNSSVLDSPDNLCVTPGGGILFCEDDASVDSDTHPLAPGITDINRLVGMGRSGEPFEFAVNIFSDSEFAGACFSPDGEILFVNIQGGNSIGSGMTCAITGPWRRGAL
jgi:secreted PhoX family phosphatase